MFLDIPFIGQLGFQNPASVIALGIENLHHSIFYVLILILVPILYLLWKIMYRHAYAWEHPIKLQRSHFVEYRDQYLMWNSMIHGVYLEIIWTLSPTICLV